MSGLGQYKIDARLGKFSVIPGLEGIVGCDMMDVAQKTNIGKFGLAEFTGIRYDKDFL